MGWTRGDDYHGSRSYAVDEPPVGTAGRITAWLARLGRALANIVVRSGRSPSDLSALLFEGQRSFTQLGGDNRRQSSDQGLDDLFPTKPTTRDNNFRVLP